MGPKSTITLHGFRSFNILIGIAFTSITIHLFSVFFFFFFCIHALVLFRCVL